MTKQECEVENEQKYFTFSERLKLFSGFYPGVKACSQNFNFIDTGVAVFGFVIVSLVFVTSAGLAAWIHRNKKHIVIRRSQPKFLFLVLFGICMNVSTIIPVVLDERMISACHQSGSLFRPNSKKLVYSNWTVNAALCHFCMVMDFL